LRQINNNEYELLKSIIDSKFGIGTMKKVVSHFILLKNNSSNQYFTLNKENLNLIKILKMVKSVFSIGFPLIEIKDSNIFFHPTAIEVLRQFTNNKIKITKKAADLYLYGRDLFKSSILWYNVNLKKGDNVIILDNQENSIGIGELLIPIDKFKKIESSKVVVKNLIDLGWYLRAEN
jgi:ribosome biogenesis protein Nip4